MLTHTKRKLRKLSSKICQIQLDVFSANAVGYILFQQLGIIQFRYFKTFVVEIKNALNFVMISRKIYPLNQNIIIKINSYYVVMREPYALSTSDSYKINRH